MKKTMSGRMKKWGLLFAVLVCCVFIGSSTQVEAASSKAKALIAYKSMLSSKAKLMKYTCYEKEYMNLKKDVTFALAYINNDSVPELILNVYDTQYLFTYKGGKLKKVGESFLQWHSAPTFVYYRKTGVFRSVEFFDDSSWQNFYTLKNGKQSRIVGKELAGSKVVKYYAGANGKKISKASFSKLLKNKVKNTKATTIKVYRLNTAANRKKYLK